MLDAGMAGPSSVLAAGPQLEAVLASSDMESEGCKVNKVKPA